MARRKTSTVNYQERAAEFAVGDEVETPNGTPGRITALWPAIGMADLEFPGGSRRWPVEELYRSQGSWRVSPVGENVPGGLPTVSVPGGPVPPIPRLKEASPEAMERVARAFVKKALYWAAKDRRYQATSEELEGESYYCPKCKARGDLVPMKKAIYKRRGGQSDHLLGCPKCLFLIKRSDIVGHPEYQDEVV